MIMHMDKRLAHPLVAKEVRCPALTMSVEGFSTLYLVLILHRFVDSKGTVGRQQVRPVKSA